MYKYVGGGAYIPGVPARDLTDEEFRAFQRTAEPDLDRATIYEHQDDREHPRLAARAERLADAHDHDPLAVEG